ncbi:MAG: hypothetical protein GY847_10715 [Proteobacteria bacterium]|nr:hypothetical protein [Pseudomonadota bacterium]
MKMRNAKQEKMERNINLFNIVVFFFLFLLSLPQSLPAAESNPIILIAPRNDIEASKRIWDAVHGQLSDLPVSLVIEWVEMLEPDLRSQVNQARKAAERRRAVTVFWADLTIPDQVFLYISQSTGERILVRNIQEGGSDEGRLETLAVIVRSSVKAVLEGGEIGIQKPVSEQEPSHVEPPAHLELSISYGLAPYSEGNQWLHGPRIGLSATLQDFVRFFIAYRILLPVSLDREHVKLTLNSHLFELGFVFRLREQNWTLEGGVAFFADLVIAQVEANSEELEKKDPSDLWLTGVSPMLRIGWSPSRFATIFLSVLLDIVFNQSEYVIEIKRKDEPESESPPTQTVVSPWIVRPFFQLGVAFSWHSQ